MSQLLCFFRGLEEGKGGCVRNIGDEHDFFRAQKAENTDPRRNYAVKYATARGHLRTAVLKRSGEEDCFGLLVWKRDSLSSGPNSVSSVRTCQILETNSASHWEGVRLPRASGKSPDFPGSSPNFPGSFGDFPGSSLTVDWIAIQRFPGSFPDFPRSSPDFPGSSPDFPGGQPFLWEAWHPLLTHKNILWKSGADAQMKRLWHNEPWFWHKQRKRL